MQYLTAMKLKYLKTETGVKMFLWCSVFSYLEYSCARVEVAIASHNRELRNKILQYTFPNWLYISIVFTVYNYTIFSRTMVIFVSDSLCLDRFLCIAVNSAQPIHFVNIQYVQLAMVTLRHSSKAWLTHVV